MKQFFSHNIEGDGFTLHATLEEAKAAATAFYDGCADLASSDGWPDESTMLAICYGEIKGAVKCVERMSWKDWLRSQGDEDAEGPFQFDEYLDYQLVDEKEAFGDDA